MAMKVMKINWRRRVLLVLAAAASMWIGRTAVTPPPAPGDPVASQAATAPSNTTLLAAIAQRRANAQVEGHGVVSRILADDNDGSRHQRFIVRLASGDTILIAHNIDVAKRVPGLRVGDQVAFNGEYEWTAQGGVIHWTHHDPAGRHTTGWIEHKGLRYQ